MTEMARARAPTSSCSLPSLMKMKDGILPRKSKSVCSLTAALVERNGAQGKTERHRLIVVSIERVDGVLEIASGRLVGVKSPGRADQSLREVAVDAPVQRRVGIGPRVARHGGSFKESR